MSVIDTCDRLTPLMQEICSTAEKVLKQGEDVMNSWCRETIEKIGRCITDPSVVLETIKDLTKNFTIKEQQPKEPQEENKDSDDNLTQIEERHEQILSGLTELLTNYLQSKTEFEKIGENANLQREKTEKEFKLFLE